MILSGADKMKAEAPRGYYAGLVAQVEKAGPTLEHAEDVEKDLRRTFPGHRLYSGTRARATTDTLRRVLLAYSVRNPGVGYCQSMNVLAGWLLLVLARDEDAFWVLCAVVEKACPRYYTPNMVGCQVDLRVFTDLLAQQCPQLGRTFDACGLSLAAATTRWFLCLFVTVLPSETTLRVWDTFFLHGTLILFRAGVAVLQHLEPLFASTRDTNVLIRTLQQGPRTLYDHGALFRAMRALAGVSYRTVDRLQAAHSRAVRAEMEAINKRKDVQALLRATKFDRSDIDRLSRKFSSMPGTERTAKGAAALNLAQFQELVAQTMPAWHQDAQQLASMFRVFDQDADGLLSFRELLTGLSLLSSADSDEKLSVMFRLHDTDGAGTLAYPGVCGLLRSILLAACRDVANDDAVVATLATKLFVALNVPPDGRVSEDQVRDAVRADPVLQEALNADLFDLAMKPLVDDGRFKEDIDTTDDDDDDDDDEGGASSSKTSATATTTTTTTTTTAAAVVTPVVPQRQRPRPPLPRKPSKQVVSRISFMFGAAPNFSEESAKASAPAGTGTSALRQPLLSDVDTRESDGDSDSDIDSAAPAGDPVEPAATAVTVPQITDELGNQAPELAYRDLDRDTVYCSPVREFFKAIWRAFLIAIGR